ncbi:MAG TPA: hypothetical protein VK772_10905, partial [Puia sp.]|nr:hypothetical protein [Puia sp.]
SKEREYIRAFIRNVQDDTANLQRIIKLDNRQVQGIDSFLQLRHADLKQNSNRRDFYVLAFGNFYSSASFTSNNATLQQLKSTGDYRLIKKDHVADSLSKYDTDIQSLSSQTNYYNEYFKEILYRLDEFTDMSVYGDTSYVKDGIFSNKSFPELSVSDGQLRILFNKAFDFRLITSSYANGMLKPQLENATRLISFLRKEYTIEND